jgi:transcriptional antiterminator NusG
VSLCREHLTEQALQSVFVLTYDRMRRYGGVWHLEQKLLFPKTVFLESKNEKILSEEFRKYHMFHIHEDDLRPVSKEVEDFLDRLCGKERRLKMSRGIICRGAARITEGPLRGLENRIHKIDRHKRMAQIKTAVNHGECSVMPGFGTAYIPAGLEITEKIK